MPMQVDLESQFLFEKNGKQKWSDTKFVAVQQKDNPVKAKSL